MPLFRNNMLGFIPEVDWMSVDFQVESLTDPIDRLFRAERTDNIMVAWQTLAAEYKRPVMARFHGFDTEAQKLFNIPVDTHNIEKGLIKIKKNMSEQIRIWQRQGVQGDQNIYDYVFNDGLRLAQAVVTRSKVAKNELLATGAVTIKENDLDLTVTFGIPEKNMGFTLDFSGDIPAQLQAIVEYAADIGIKLNGMVLPRAVLSKFQRNKALQVIINGVYAEGALIRRSALEAFLSEEYGINTVILNDDVYNIENGFDADGRPLVTKKRFFPEHKVAFFGANSAGGIGASLWGDPPEVDVSKYFEGGVSSSSESPFVFISQWAEHDPAVLWTKASGLFMPVLFDPNSLIVATVADGWLNSPTVASMSEQTIWGHAISDLQTSVTVTGRAITGTLKYVSTGALARDWGAGYFIALQLSGIDPNATSVKIGLEPSVGSGLVEIDNDKNGIFKVTAKDLQKFKVVSSSDKHATVDTYDLSGLTLQAAG